MNIQNITLYRVEIPMISSFKTSFGEIRRRPTLIVKIVTDAGIEAFGESAALPFPSYKPETTDTCILVNQKYIAPLILRKNFRDAEEFFHLLDPIKGNNFAKTGVETAVWMALSINNNKSLTSYLGGKKKKIEVGESVGIKKTVDATLEEISARIHEGHRRIKLKIQPGWDIKIVEAVRKKFGDITLAVDANSAYTLADVPIFKELDYYQLMMVEQPLADNDIVDHSILQKQIKTPICLDESIASAEDARRAIYLGSCRIINIKPGRVGGLLESKKIHDICKKNNVGVWCGGMLESGIGRAYNIALAAMPNCIYPADMSPNDMYFSDDLVKNSYAVDKEGCIEIPKQTGLGYEVDEKKIKKYTTLRIICR